MPVFCVLAHREPDLLARLAKRLSPYPVVVHVDGSFSQQPFQRACANLPNVDFLTEAQRRPLHWGAWSIVAATETVFDRAMSAHSSGDDEHLVLLSGQDYPLRPVAEIDRVLRAGPPVRVRYAGLDSSSELGAEFLRRVFAKDLVVPGSKLQNKHVGRVARKATALAQVNLERIRNRLPRHVPEGYRWATGSQHFALTPGVLKEIRSRSTPELVRFMRTTFAPDEKYYHSLIASSAWGERLYPDGPESTESFLATRLEVLHVLDPALRKVFTRDDLDYLDSRTDKLFVRKVSLPRSETLLDHLDARDG